MLIREAQEGDLLDLLELYMQLHNNPLPEYTEKLQRIWDEIMHDSNHHILLGMEYNQILCSCVLIIVPNLTQMQRPYALIENVITDGSVRKRGYGTQILNRAREIAKEENCYKIMLMTGSKEETTLKFYERAGYNREDKTAFIQWL